MKRNIWIYRGVIVGLAIGLVFGVWWLFTPHQQIVFPQHENQKHSSSGASTQQASPDPPVYDKKLAKKGFEIIFGALEKSGALKRVSPASKYLKDAVASGDKGEISRAFLDSVYSRNWKMSEVVPVLQSYLTDSNPFVRYNAAHALFTAGDRSGFSMLVALVQSIDPIDGIGQDVRIEAAQTLAKFREMEASASIIDLYSRTRNGDLLTALSRLGIRYPQAAQFGFIADSSVLSEYAIIGAAEFIPQITSVFQSSPKPELKSAAAFALATMTSDQAAINYLIETAQPAINAKLGFVGTPAPGQPGFELGQQALKYLGSIQSPQAKQALELALDSQIPSVVQIATVNLIFNQGGSEKANQVVAQALSDGTKNALGVELSLNIAAQINDPQVQAAGKKFAQQEGSGLWSLYTVERRGWPIHNWIDNYVVKLSK